MECRPCLHHDSESFAGEFLPVSTIGNNKAIVATVYVAAFTFCRMDFTFNDRNGLSLPCVRSISGQTVEIPYMSKNFRFDLQEIHNNCITQLFNTTSCNFYTAEKGQCAAWCEVYCPPLAATK